MNLDVSNQFAFHSGFTTLFEPKSRIFKEWGKVQLHFQCMFGCVFFLKKIPINCISSCILLLLCVTLSIGKVMLKYFKEIKHEDSNPKW